MNSNAARMLERMTRDARRVRSMLGFARWLKIVKGPGKEENDGKESVRERPWTVSIAGSWTSIILGIRRDGGGGGDRGREGRRGRQGT